MNKPALLLSLSIIFLTSCVAWQQRKLLNTHQKQLKSAAMTDISAEEKLDVLASSLVQMMDEGLRFVNIKKGVKYVQCYEKENSTSIEKIFSDIEAWQKGLTTVERVTLGVRLLNKPYTKDLLGLVPKFKRKYEQIKFAARLSAKLQGILFDLVS